MKVRPVGDRILVRREDPVEVTKGGLHIPEQAKDPTQAGFVLAVGEGRGFDQAGVEETRVYVAGPDPIPVSQQTITIRKRSPLSVKPGDKVLFGKYAGTEVEVDGEKLFLLREDEVVAVLEDEAPKPS